MASFTFTPDGKQLVSVDIVACAGADHSVRLVDAESGAELKSFHGHGSWICAIAVGPDNKRLVSGSEDQTVRIWNIDSGEELATLKGHSGRVTSVSFSRDGVKKLLAFVAL